MKSGTVSDEEGTRQHKSMAMGKKIEDQGSFGVTKLGEGCVPCSDKGGRAMSDGDRSARPMISRGAGMMGATAQSDHGSHSW